MAPRFWIWHQESVCGTYVFGVFVDRWFTWFKKNPLYVNLSTRLAQPSPRPQNLFASNQAETIFRSRKGGSHSNQAGTLKFWRQPMTDTLQLVAILPLPSANVQLNCLLPNAWLYSETSLPKYNTQHANRLAKGCGLISQRCTTCQPRTTKIRAIRRSATKSFKI